MDSGVGAVMRFPRKLSHFAVLFAAFWQGMGWRLSGELPMESVFTTYVGKFCFDFNTDHKQEAGEFFFRVTGKVEVGPQEPEQDFSNGPPCYGPCETQGNLYLVVFDDEERHWDHAQRDWSDLTCEEMLHYSSFATPLTPLNGQINRTIFVHESLRPRFWYFTFAACGVNFVEPVSFELHGQNPQMGFQSEFGVDEEGNLALQASAAVLFLGVSLCWRHMAQRSTGAEAMRSRPILRILFISAVCSALGATFRALHYMAFAYTGYGVGFFDVLGQLSVCAAKALLTVLQLLVAKGWSLFYGQQELLQRRCTLCMLAIVVLTSVACEIHADYVQDWSVSLYMYESWTGMAILFLNILLFAEAWRSMCKTYDRESSEEVRVFYATISAANLVYFLSLPVLCALSAAFNPWVRAKYVNRVEVATRLVATVLLALCLRPSRLDAMVNARLEEGLGDLCEDTTEERDEDSDERALD